VRVRDRVDSANNVATADAAVPPAKARREPVDIRPGSALPDEAATSRSQADATKTNGIGQIDRKIEIFLERGSDRRRARRRAGAF
jgi:hypothetical protein